MSIGDTAQSVVRGYVALFKESTFGTYPATGATGASSLEPISCTFKVNIDSQKLDTISTNRGFSKRVQLGKSVTGTLDQFLHPHESVLMLANALGGGIATSSLTGAYQHVISAGQMDTAPASLAFNVRKGDTQCFGYAGGRVNNVKITANVGEPVRVSYDFIFKDVTTTVSDISASLSLSSVLPMVFTGGVYRYSTTEALADTTTSEERIQSCELTVANNLHVGRALGSDVLQVLQPTRRNVQLTVTQRFDTMTSYNRFVQATVGSVILKFTGESLSAEYPYSMKIALPKVYLNAPDPDLSGTGDVLKQNISFDVVVDNVNTSTGKDINITVHNATASY